MTYAPLAMEGKAKVDRFLSSARVRQFLTAFSRSGTASELDHCGEWTCITCLQGKTSPDPLMAAVCVCVWRGGGVHYNDDRIYTHCSRE